MGRAAGLAVGSAIVASACNIVPANAKDVPDEVKNTRSYHPNMECRRLGKTGLWVSAVSLDGHWKRIDKVIKAKAKVNPYAGPADRGDVGVFLKNRYEVVSRCIEVGINLIDFAGDAEPETYCKVLQGRRDKMYLAYSHPASELQRLSRREAPPPASHPGVGQKDRQARQGRRRANDAEGQPCHRRRGRQARGQEVARECVALPRRRKCRRSGGPGRTRSVP